MNGGVVCVMSQSSVMELISLGVSLCKGSHPEEFVFLLDNIFLIDNYLWCPVIDRTA